MANANHGAAPENDQVQFDSLNVEVCEPADVVAETRFARCGIFCASG
jgi:hypothetical protein